VRACEKFLEEWYEKESMHPFPFPEKECPQRLMLAARRSHVIALRGLMRDPAIAHRLVQHTINGYGRELIESSDERLEVLADSLALVNVGAYRLSIYKIDRMLRSMWNGFADEWRAVEPDRSREYDEVQFCGVRYGDEEHDKYFNWLDMDIVDPMSMKWAVEFIVDPSLVHRRACKQLRRARTLWRDRILAAQAAEAL